MNKLELSKIQTYLRELFDNDDIKVTSRPQLTDSAEVSIGSEFIAVINKDVEDGETSYSFQMAILEEDL